MQNREQPNGSNAWLVSGEHTASGNPMIANDPHLTMNTPAIWYEAHLVFNRDGEEWHINGVNPPGEPGALSGLQQRRLLGHDRQPDGHHGLLQ